MCGLNINKYGFVSVCKMMNISAIFTYKVSDKVDRVGSTNISYNVSGTVDRIGSTNISYNVSDRINRIGSKHPKLPPFLLPHL